MSDKPIMHGRDHRPGGMDPIPGLPSTLREQVTATDALSIPGTNLATLPWTDGATSGDTLLDLSTYGQANFVSEGVYAIGVIVQVTTNMPNGTGFYAQIERWDAEFQSVSLSVAATTSIPQPIAGVSLVSYFPAGGGFGVSVYNYASSSRSFYIFRAVVQKIS